MLYPITTEIKNLLATLDHVADIRDQQKQPAGEVHLTKQVFNLFCSALGRQIVSPGIPEYRYLGPGHRYRGMVIKETPE